MSPRKNWDAADLKQALAKGGATERGSIRKLAMPGTHKPKRISLIPPLYRSNLEAAYANKLDIEMKVGLIRSWRYEPMSLKLSKGKRYRPDFLIEHPSGLGRRLEFVEVKGAWGKNRRDGMTHLKWAAQLYPMFTWTLAWVDAGVWHSANVEV